MNKKGFKAYKKYWEDQADFFDKAPWDKDKILKLILLTDFVDNIKELEFSSHSLKIENGKNILRIKVPYNFFEIDDFEFQSLELLGIQKNWIKEISIEKSRCSNV